ncbi:serine/threonine-protein kinase [Nocardia cyriacigeorgica]|uniref:serine/threonine-protein kinase n=1 Tax=Nocardia cyriacigeorgica TaxID=135487 RepID=UPI0024578A68|nr:serine/threonine-protein kinase [Nocardia cyriacigeorgica]
MGQSLADGQEFAGYRIDRLLGIGGMGEVYLARDRDLPRPVALKLLSRALTNDAEVRERFRREADTAARLSHPDIVAVHARGEQDGQLWIAMEYVDGTDVGAVLGQGPLHPAHAVRVVDTTARALDHAHRAGVLHRDVKPANILLARGSQERVLLADFGIAKALDESVGLTRTGEVFASLRYAAPEQFDADAEIDHRVDVYALGATLFHMLTGTPPYPGTNSAQLIHAHLNLPIPTPSSRNPALPPGFDAVIGRAMAKNPAHRFDSCGELAAAANEALSGAPMQFPGHVAPPAPGPAAESKGRRIALISAAVIALVLVLGGAGVAVAVAMRNSAAAEQQAQKQESDRQRAEDARAAAQQAGCDFAAALTTYDYRDLDSYKKAVDTGSTGAFKAEFDSTYPNLEELMVQSGATSRGSDFQCFHKTGDENRAEITVLANQTVSKTGDPAPQARQYSFAMTMEQVDGRWLCSKVEINQPK